MSLIKHERHARWPLETLWNQDVVDEMFRNFFSRESLLGRAAEGGADLMKIEEFLDGDTCVIRAELPGIDPDKDVEISISEGVLHLRAERTERTQEDRADGYRSEFHYGSLARSLRLPEGATESDITASYQDGILEVRVPVPKAMTTEARKRIPISRS